MAILWDKADDAIWFAQLKGYRDAVLLHLIVERLPGSRGWDWAVWEPAGQVIKQRGVAHSAEDAATAAEAAAIHWREGFE